MVTSRKVGQQIYLQNEVAKCSGGCLRQVTLIFSMGEVTHNEYHVGGKSRHKIAKQF